MNIGSYEIKEKLKEVIKGQDEYISLLSTLVLRQNIHINNTYLSFEGASRVLVMGQTGSGKTCTIKNLEKILDNNYSIVFLNMSELTGSGWKGPNIDSIIAKILLAWKKQLDILLNKHNISVTSVNANEIQLYSLVALRQVVLVLDEFDKIIIPVSEHSENKKALQEDLLHFMEDYRIYTNYGPYALNLEASLLNCIMIFMGAFENLQRRQEKQVFSAGFTPPPSLNENKIDLKDFLISEGMKTELLGRFNYIFKLNVLSKEVLLQIVKSSPKLKQFSAEMQALGYTVLIHEDFFQSIYNKLTNLKLGARELNEVLDGYLLRCFEFLSEYNLKLIPLKDIEILPHEQLKRELNKKEMSN